MLTTDQKGAIAETAIAHAALKLGIDVYRPVAEGGRYDMIFDVGTQLLRVQCKWARGKATSSSSGATRPGGPVAGLRTAQYTAAEIDAIAAYCPDVDSCFFLVHSRSIGEESVHLRLARSQQPGVESELGGRL